MMKNLFFIGLMAILFSCGGNETENTMTVSGTVKGLKKGTLYLQKIPDSALVTIDSILVDGDGNFSFKTEVESPEIFYLYLDKKDNNDINDRISFFGEPGNITINTSWNTFDSNAKIKGSESHKKLEEYRKVMTRFNTKNLELMNSSIKPEVASDSLLLDSIQKISDKNVQRGYAYAVNFALHNKDSYIAPYIALHDISDANIKYLDSIHSSLSPRVANSKYGKELKQHLDNLRE